MSYAQRTDLNRPVPINAPTGQPYGVRAEQVAAQRAIPIAPPPAPAMAPSNAGPAPAPMGPLPVVPLDADSTRPGEPVTAGVPVGAGPGPEVLGLPDENGVDDLALWLPMLEFAASQPGASPQTRNFVRRLRGSAPVK